MCWVVYLGLCLIMHYLWEQQLLSNSSLYEIGTFKGTLKFGQRQEEDCTLQDELEQAVFGDEQGFMGSLGGDPRDCAVLISGLPGPVTATLTRRLTLEGITRERVLFCDFI